ncbi:MAG: TlpA family protein disulfide reductase [Deltaproteobacteria bacterium]|nr:TlpA family protein disulfide reductase [Deltaproteobacteria bacterium]
MRSKLKSIIIAVFFAALFCSSGCNEESSSLIAAPNFVLSDISGQAVSLKEYRGRIVLLDFWATWCGPCRMSIPEMVKLGEKYREKGVVILGISLDDANRVSNEQLESFKQKQKINYRILRHDMKVIHDYFGNENVSIPTLFVIDQQGSIRDKIVGYRPGVLENSLRRIL